MPIPFIAESIFQGTPNVPFFYTIVKTLPWLLLVYILKLYFGGAKNSSERLMHSKVIMITGGTSGIGAAIAQSLAQRGAQLILLSHHPPTDSFLVEYIDDLRTSTNNELIYAEQADLSSLHSIRLFATKWVDNAPPRRLDMVILCANTMSPRYGTKSKTQDGLESNWGINYLANFHLLSILSPAIRAQPADRDVRIIIATCSSYIGGDLRALKDAKEPLPKGKEYGSSKLALMVFAQAFQKHLDVYERPDKQPNNARVILADPSLTRTPGMRRWLSMGSLLGLLLYLVSWPIWWLILKSAEQGAQTILNAAMDEDLAKGNGARFRKECKDVDYIRDDIVDTVIAQKLWSFSEIQIMALEKEGARKRALAKKEREGIEQETERNAKQASTPIRGGDMGIITSGSKRSRKNDS